MRSPFLALLVLSSVSLCYQGPWQPVVYDYYHIDLSEIGGHPQFDGNFEGPHHQHGGKSPVIPRDAIVDVVNELGIKLLAIHNEHNENNIAISPYGAFSVLAALTEGLQGEAAHEILHAAHIPKDKHVLRVGLRDIHRHLKSYFIPEEGFLAGLTLNLNNVTLKSEYEDVLHFYGFDYGSFNNALYPEPPTTKKPAAEGTTLETGLTISEEETTTVITTEKSEEITKDVLIRVGGSSSERTIVDTTTRTEPQTTITSTSLPTTTDKETTSTLPPAATTTVESTTTNKPEITTEESQATTTVTTLPSSTKETTTQIPQATTTSTETATKIPETTVTETTNPPETTTTMTTSETATETTNPPETTTAMTTSQTVTEATNPPETTTTTTISQTATETPNPLETTTTITTSQTATETINPPETTTTKLPETTLMTTNTPLRTTREVTSTTVMPESTTETQTITIPTEAMTIEEAVTGGQPLQELETTTPFFFETTPEFQTTNFDYNYNNYDANNVSPVYDENNVPDVDNNFKKRQTRSVVDYVLARFYDGRHHYEVPKYIPQEPLTFAVYGKFRESGINFMKYDTVLPYFYVQNLNALALSFPLDSSKYYLLLLLPVGDNGVDQLICDLRLHGNLRYIIDNLKLTHVVATIPSFMLKGYVTLTPALQRLGIRKIFEPRQADFSPMTNETDIYVTNIEQAVTVTIRNYLDPSSQRYKNFQQYPPVYFKADHPFLYFVIDSELHVALMIGKVINPLNSRIR